MATQKKYACPYCKERFTRDKLIIHVEKKHEELIPDGYTATRVIFNDINHTSGGRCRACGNSTEWNEKTGRYNVLCGRESCTQAMREKYKKNMLRVRGTYNILNDPEQQKKMLAGKKSFGTYKFSDGGKVDYTGTYERKALEFMDTVMGISSADIISPGPTIEYEYNGSKHFYIPDFLYVPYNLIIEIKDGGNNLNTKESPSMKASREKTIEKERFITDAGLYSYIRLTNNEFSQLLEIFMEIKDKILTRDYTPTIRINESYIHYPKRLISTTCTGGALQYEF